MVSVGGLPRVFYEGSNSVGLNAITPLVDVGIFRDTNEGSLPVLTGTLYIDNSTQGTNVTCKLLGTLSFRSTVVN